MGTLTLCDPTVFTQVEPCSGCHALEGELFHHMIQKEVPSHVCITEIYTGIHTRMFSYQS